MTDPRPTGWRVSLGTRLFCWMVLVVCEALVALAIWDDDEAWTPGVAAFFVGFALAPVLFVLAVNLPVAWIADDDLVFRNVRRTRRLPLASIGSLQPRDWALRVTRSDGERPAWLWSLPKVPFSDFRTKPSSTDLACITVADAARERGATVELIDVRPADPQARRKR